MDGLFSKILVALAMEDETTGTIAKLGLALAGVHGASVRFVSVVPPDPPSIAPVAGLAAGERIMIQTSRSMDDALAERSLMLSELIAAQAGDAPADQVVRYGVPKEEIIAEAETWEADLVVVGSRARSWFDRLLEPSVSGDVARGAGRPVLIVPDGAT